MPSSLGATSCPETGCAPIPKNRDRYAEVKHQVAGRRFSDSMLYSNQRAWIVYDLCELAFASDPGHAHDPHPRPAT